MTRKMVILLLIGALAVPSVAFARQQQQDVVKSAPGLKAVDHYTLVGSKHLLTGYEALNTDGDINVVVEIPTGTTAKWQVTPDDGALKWEFKNGKPRIVKYLGYPGNYGMIPRTLLPEELGGDGDPLDVIVLGPAVHRGSVVKAKLLGVLKYLDAGEQDDKLFAVLFDTPLYEANSLKELDEKFPGVTSIIEIWFSHYKGPGIMEFKGYGDKKEAREILNAAIKAFK